MPIHAYDNLVKVNKMLDRDTITQQGKAPRDFRRCHNDFLDCLEKTKDIIKEQDNGDFEEYQDCIKKAMELLN